MVNIYENVERRASRTLSALASSFSLGLHSHTPLLFRSGETCPQWELRYFQSKKWLSRVYKLGLSYSFAWETGTDFHMFWMPHKKLWRVQQGNESRTADYLNQMPELIRKLTSLDMEKAEIRKQGPFVTVQLIPIPGCFVWTLIPPMHYFVRLKPEEVKAMKEIPRLLENCLKQLASPPEDNSIFVAR